MKIRISVLFLLVAVLLAAASCKPNSSSDGGDHLPPKVMQKLLLDINVAEAYSMVIKDSLHRAGVKNIDSLSSFYQEIFHHYNITQTQFNESFNWYKGHPDELDSIYTKNQAIISKLQARPLYKKP